MYGHVETVRLLLTCPALSQQQQQPQQQQQGPDAQLTPGATGSTSSTSDGDQHMLRKQLLAMVSDVGASALHFAADAGHVDVVRLLLTFGECSE
jgi:ankyrin repeat protein